MIVSLSTRLRAFPAGEKQFDRFDGQLDGNDIPRDGKATHAEYPLGVPQNCLPLGPKQMKYWLEPSGSRRERSVDMSIALNGGLIAIVSVAITKP